MYKYTNEEFGRDLKEMDDRRHAEQQVQIDLFIPAIVHAQRKMRKSPYKFAYEIRQIDRMITYIARYRFVPESYQRMLETYRLMSA